MLVRRTQHHGMEQLASRRDDSRRILVWRCEGHLRKCVGSMTAKPSGFCSTNRHTWCMKTSTMTPLPQLFLLLEKNPLFELFSFCFGSGATGAGLLL